MKIIKTNKLQKMKQISNKAKSAKMQIKPFIKRRWLLSLLMSMVMFSGLNAQNTGEMRFFNLVLPDSSLVSHKLTDGINIHFQDSIIVVNGLNYYMEDIVKRKSAR